MTTESASSLPSLATHCIGPNKKAFTQLIKRHHNAVRNAQFTHLILPPPPRPLCFHCESICGLSALSYCVDFSSIQWPRGSILSLFLVLH